MHTYRASCPPTSRPTRRKYEACYKFSGFGPNNQLKHKDDQEFGKQQCRVICDAADTSPSRPTASMLPAGCNESRPNDTLASNPSFSNNTLPVAVAGFRHLLWGLGRLRSLPALVQPGAPVRFLVWCLTILAETWRTPLSADLSIPGEKRSRADEVEI